MAQHGKLLDAVKGQPRAVWVTAFAAVIAFMGIGLVDPILKSIGEGLHASPEQVTLLFSSYIFVQVFAMLVTGVFSARFGAKRTVLTGLALIVVFAGLSGTSTSIAELVGLRAFWGAGNAFFIATALAVIVGAASGGQGPAILLYEAALGLGLSVGPLIGAALGNISWRAPFFGTSVLMAVALLLCLTMLPDDRATGEGRSVLAPLRALRHRGLFTVASSAFFYNFAFFTVLAWTPFVLGWGPTAIGLLFFGWGVLVAVSSVVWAPRLAARLGDTSAMLLALAAFATLLAVDAVGSPPAVAVVTVLSGACLGLLNTLYTGAAMAVSDSPRPVASAGYNFLRWFGGATGATLVGHIANWTGDVQAPFIVAAGLIAVGAIVLVAGRRTLGSLHGVPAMAPALANAD
ncbi:MAG: transporter, family, multidrug resistance protein [Actinomycetota bacterium]|jgi:predicted MFS family arabinose efflux permease|nr:transporter, family, multidrug resistance protein [Actinomycetota bacterium]MDQ1641470.1 transporter, family, multidrug resistance protein [Actinomycetota bacterium]